MKADQLAVALCLVPLVTKLQPSANAEYRPDSKVHVAIMGPIWDQQDPGGSHAGPMNFAIWEGTGLILGLHPADERQRYIVTMSLIGWVQA